MINISDEDKAIWGLDSVKKYLSINIPGKNILLGNSDINWQKFELTETLESNSQLTFSGCNAARVKFECAALAEDIRNEYIEITIRADGTEAIPLFSGYVDNQERTSTEDISCKITAYDYFYKMRSMNMAEWFNGLTFPISLRSFRQALAAECGVNLISRDLIFDNLTLDKTVSPDAIGAVDLWKNICTLNGVYGRLTRTGQLDLMELPRFAINIPEHIDPGVVIDPDAQQIMQNRYKKIEYDNYTVSKIDKVQIHESTDDIGGIYGTGTNAYIVENNWMTYGRSAEELARMAQTLYEHVKDYSYMPAKITAPGLPYLEPGDKIESRTRTSEVLTYVLSRTLKGIQILDDVYTAPGTKTRKAAVDDVNTKITQLAGKTNRLTRDVEHTQSEISDLAEGVSSRITQLSDSVSVEINNIYNQLDGSINVYNVTEVPTLNNFPAWDFTYNIPCNNTVQTTDNLRFEYNDAYYRKNVRAMAYNINTGITYRFRSDEEGNWYWEEIADTEYAILMQKITSLEVKDGEITSNVAELYSDVASLGKITETHSTQIKQTANDITLEAKRAKDREDTLASSISINANAIVSKVSKGNISSEISQEAGKISISSNRLKISSTNFTLAEDGTMTCKNAAISGYTKTAELNAEIAKVNNLIAAKASIDQLNATNAAVNNLSTSKASIDQLNAVAATVNTINANYITAGGVSTVISNASSLTTNNLHIRDGLWMKRADTGNDTKVTLLQRITVGSNTWLIPAIKL